MEMSRFFNVFIVIGMIIMALSLIAIIALIVLCIVLIKKLFRSIIKLCKKGAQMWNSMREEYIEEMKNATVEEALSLSNIEDVFSL